MIAATINATNVENITINNYVICNFENMAVDSDEETTISSPEEAVVTRDKVSNVQFVIAWTRWHRVGINEIVSELTLGRAWVYYRYLRLVEDGVPLGAPVFGPPWAESDVVGLTAHIMETEQNG